jgi:hypothetical protein
MRFAAHSVGHADVVDMQVWWTCGCGTVQGDSWHDTPLTRHHPHPQQATASKHNIMTHTLSEQARKQHQQLAGPQRLSERLREWHL